MQMSINKEIEKLKQLYSEQSYNEAYLLALKLSSQSVHEGLWVLGDFYFFGYSKVVEDRRQALELYEKALLLGSYKAGISLASFYEPDLDDAAKNFQARDKSIAYYSKVFELASKEANSGNPEAMYYLGLLYDSGLGIEENKNIAFEWYNSAYINGYNFALNKLYEFYSSKKSTFYNVDKAKKCLKELNDLGIRVV